ncbi:flavoprotein [Streptomyces sp. N35]|uniref:flavoprotein n=1 Tax=Streptomyces sp. N35 TaxID=2795730 RepID=UPI0018F47995|nr:flavoprotein [Streptomyces sp. N35]
MTHPLGRLLIGVTGSSATTAADLLVKRALDIYADSVTVVASPAALAFLPRLDRVAIYTDENWATDPNPLHTKLLDQCDHFLVAPTTANTLAKAAHGLTDNLLCALILKQSSRSSVSFYPAMHGDMWHARVTQDNVAKLRAYGHHVLTPEPGPSRSSDDPCSAVGTIPGTALEQLAAMVSASHA